jgi:hypothetical protein
MINFYQTFVVVVYILQGISLLIYTLSVFPSEKKEKWFRLDNNKIRFRCFISKKIRILILGLIIFLIIASVAKWTLSIYSDASVLILGLQRWIYVIISLDLLIDYNSTVTDVIKLKNSQEMMSRIKAQMTLSEITIMEVLQSRGVFKKIWITIISIELVDLTMSLLRDLSVTGYFYPQALLELNIVRFAHYAILFLATAAVCIFTNIRFYSITFNKECIMSMLRIGLFVAYINLSWIVLYILWIFVDRTLYNIIIISFVEEVVFIAFNIQIIFMLI